MNTRKPMRETQSAKVLRGYLESTGIGLDEAAEKSGLSKAFLYMVLQGRHQVGIESAYKLKNGLGISLGKWETKEENV
jgi:transcriptional regulator with XRE-family HTH domain